MTSGGDNFNDFPEIVPTRKITNKNREDFSFSRPWPWAYFLNGPNAAASLAPTLIRHWADTVRLHFTLTDGVPSHRSLQNVDVEFLRAL